jgi:DNA-binding NarL/FixJ family response regulator
VLLVDDHPVFLEGLFTILSLRDPEIEVVGTATNGREALDAAEELAPDVILLDIKMPVMDGVDVARILKDRMPSIAIIMLTTFDDRPLIRSALQAGATGYLLKDAEAGQIVDAIKHVTRENIVISGDLAIRLSAGEPSVERADTNTKSDQSAYPEATKHDVEIIEELSERQRDILRLLARGLSNHEISRELFLSEKTVRNYVSQIYEMLNIHTRTKVALWALQHVDNPTDGRNEDR